jgi:hypothetical protein
MVEETMETYDCCSTQGHTSIACYSRMSMNNIMWSQIPYPKLRAMPLTWKEQKRIQRMEDL